MVSIASGTQCRAHSYPKRATHGRGEQPVYSSGAHCISMRMRSMRMRICELVCCGARASDCVRVCVCVYFARTFHTCWRVANSQCTYFFPIYICTQLCCLERRCTQDFIDVVVLRNVAERERMCAFRCNETDTCNWLHLLK